MQTLPSALPIQRFFPAMWHHEFWQKCRLQCVMTYKSVHCSGCPSNSSNLMISALRSRSLPITVLHATAAITSMAAT